MTILLQSALYTGIFPFDKLFSTELSTDPVDKISNYLILTARRFFTPIIHPKYHKNQL
jgi:hypothetical protein